MFLGTQRDLVRVSTPVATHPIHLTPIRDISSSRLTANWERVNYERLSRMIAHTCHEMYQKKQAEGREGEDGEGVSGEGRGEEGERGGGGVSGEGREGEGERGGGGGSVEGRGEGRGDERIESSLFSSSKSAASPGALSIHRRARKSTLKEVASAFFSKLSKVFKRWSKRSPHQQSQPQPDEPQPSLITTLESDPDNIEELFSDFLHSLHEKMGKSKEMNEMILSHSIRLIDSGGQPQFHELFSMFLHSISGFVSVFKLSECLSSHGEVVFYNEAGNPTNDPYESHYSHEQVIRHDLQAIHSEATRSGIDQMPNLAFVGTFLDEKDACRDESPDAKDERLHTIITEMLPPEMQQCVITNGSSLREATFRINARSPEERDFQTVGRLKQSLMLRSRAKPRDLPLKWHGYEVALHMLMQELKRQSLSRQECEFIGHLLGFDFDQLNAALDYLRQLNIIAYYKVLPNVIFGSSQVILDKVTELVCYSLHLKKGHCAVGGAERRFLQEGIISLEFLKSPALSKHYTGELFGPKELLDVLVSLFVVSEVGMGEYIMPSVLDVSSIYPSPSLPDGSVRSSFILHFSKKSPMFGIFCCTTASLMSSAGWKLLTEGGEVVQVA